MKSAENSKKSWQRRNYQNYMTWMKLRCIVLRWVILLLFYTFFFRIKNWTYGYGFDIMFMSNWEVSAVDLYKKSSFEVVKFDRQNYERIILLKATHLDDAVGIILFYCDETLVSFHQILFCEPFEPPISSQ